MTDRCEHLLAELALACPELAPSLARIHMTEATPEELSSATGGMTTIAMIQTNGVGRISSVLLDENPYHARMVLAHEALHLVAERVCRIEHLAGPQWDGDHRRANVALDRWINQILCDMKVCDKDDVGALGGVLPNPGMEEADIMDIWRAEAGQKQGRQSPKGGGGGAMAGCSPQGSGEKDEDESGAEQEAQDQAAHGIMASLASYSPAVAKMMTPPPPVVRWQDVLHEAAAAARGAGVSNRPRQTRAKWGRRSSDDLPKPGITTRKPQLVVIVDVSGSMSGLLDKVTAEADAIAKTAGVRLVLHDSAVLFSGEYRRGRDKITPCGGTLFEPAVHESARHARDWPGKSVVIHLTDGFPCDAWPDVPNVFASGYVAVFGGAAVTAPGRWRTRHVKGSP